MELSQESAGTSEGGDQTTMAGATDPRLRTKLREQLDYLQRSAAAFDDGHEAEAIRLATTMRVLFHEKGRNKSLLVQLAMRDTTMLATLRTHFADWRDFLNIQLDPNGRSGRGPVIFLPKLQSQFSPVPFDHWWEAGSIMNAAGSSVTRRRIIVGAANKDGGAHVDPKLECFYEELANGVYGLGLTGNMTFDGPAPYPQGVTQ